MSAPDQAHTPKFVSFVAALKELCMAHGVVLSPYGYDSLQVWDGDGASDPIHFPDIEDRTIG